jgi:O-antigen/teichoic acid export membrane protein
LAPQRHYFEDLEQSPDLGRLALRGGLAAVASTYGSGVLQIAAAIILARLLTPEDFGLVAIATLLTSFAPFLIDFGLGDATAQRRKITPRQVSSLFWISTGIGLALAAVVALCSPLIAWMYGEPRLESIALYSATTFVLWGISGQHLALLRRTMQFAVVAKMQILSIFIGLALAIPLAISGSGYWALVLRPIVSVFCIAVGVWIACEWRPGFPVLDKDVRAMVRFGMHVVGYAIVAAVARAVDRIALGFFYSPQQVGVYHNALILYENSIFSALTQIHSVGSAALGKFQSNPVDLRQKYEAALSTLAFFVMPGAVVLSVTAQDVVVLLLGEKWRVSGVLLSIIALRGIFHVIQVSQGWLHLSTGRPDRWKNWGMVTAIVQMVAVLAGLPFGPTGVAVAFVASGWLIAFPSISYAGRPVNISATSVLRSVGRQLLGALIAATSGWLLLVFVLTDNSELQRIVLLTAFCSTLYLLIVVGVLRLTDPITVARRLVQDHVPWWR